MLSSISLRLSQKFARNVVTPPINFVIVQLAERVPLLWLFLFLLFLLFYIRGWRTRTAARPPPTVQRSSVRPCFNEFRCSSVPQLSLHVYGSYHHMWDWTVGGVARQWVYWTHTSEREECLLGRRALMYDEKEPNCEQNPVEFCECVFYFSQYVQFQQIAKSTFVINAVWQNNRCCIKYFSFLLSKHFASIYCY